MTSAWAATSVSVHQALLGQSAAFIGHDMTSPISLLTNYRAREQPGDLHCSYVMQTEQLFPSLSLRQSCHGSRSKNVYKGTVADPRQRPGEEGAMTNICIAPIVCRVASCANVVRASLLLWTSG